MGSKKLRKKHSLMVMAFIVFAVLYVVFSLLPVASSLKYQVIAVVYLIPVLLACGSVLYTARKVSAPEKRFWYSLLAGLVFMTMGEIFWAGYQFLNLAYEPPHPSFSDITQLIAYVGFYSVLLSMVRFSKALSVTKARYMVDIMIAVLFAATGAFATLVLPSMAAGNAKLADEVFRTVFPVLDLGIVIGVAANIFGFQLSKWRPWEGMVALGFISFALADLGFAILSQNGMYDVSVIAALFVDLLWMTAYFLYFMAGVFRNEEKQLREAPGEIRQITRKSSHILEFAVYTFIILTMPFFVIMTNNNSAEARYGLILFGTALGVLILLRAVLVVNENNKLVSNAITDPVTGITNYRHFQERFNEEIDRAERYRELISLAFFDIDGFAKVNSIYGHAVGDRILRETAECIRHSIRLSDIVSRIGGDEFGLVMPSTNSLEAMKTCLRIQEELNRVASRESIDYTFSVGVATYPTHAISKDGLEKSADAALYWAKFHGKNQTVIFDPNVIETLNPQERVKQAEELAYMNTVHALAAAVDARDSYTQNHSRNVASLIALFAEDLRLDSEKTRTLETAALLHDVGKIGIADGILKKPEMLTEEEMQTIKEHPALSQKILAATSLQEILPWIGAHHERWDGTGYPNCLKGESIPFEARMLALCDVYDAMTSDRPYRKALPYEVAISELERGKGTQFDPELTKRFVDVLQKTESIRMAADGS